MNTNRLERPLQQFRSCILFTVERIRLVGKPWMLKWQVEAFHSISFENMVSLLRQVLVCLN